MPLMFLEPFLIGIAENPSNLPKKRRGKGYAKSAWHLTCMRLSYVPGMNAINRAKDSEKNAWHLLWVWHPWPKTLATSPKLPPQKCLASYLASAKVPGTLPCLRKSAWHLTLPPQKCLAPYLRAPYLRHHWTNDPEKSAWRLLYGTWQVCMAGT